MTVEAAFEVVLEVEVALEVEIALEVEVVLAVVLAVEVAFVYRDGGFVSFSSNRASIAVPEYIPSAIELSSVTSSAFISLNIAVYPFFKTTVEYAASVYSPSSSIVILVFSLTALGKNCAI